MQEKGVRLCLSDSDLILYGIPPPPQAEFDAKSATAIASWSLWDARQQP